MTDDQDFSLENAANQAQKIQLRTALLANRKVIPEKTRLALDNEIAKRTIAWIEKLIKVQSDAVIGVYWPIRGEPDLRPAYAKLASLGVALALPVVVDEDAPLRFLHWTPGEAMTQDRFGVAVPVKEDIVRPQALLIPCVGFNQQRRRLGYGGGFYDRTLATTPRPQTAGIAYDCGFAEFASASHDIAMDVIFTETKIFL
ncbi:5-formyltetrahydrofolate cyclo-ligase [Glaciimonas soli]|uniref:5-formyltetrahydrofolate cyclo-ligase n=1 Tax=Glaciimonas soli TaxID=2590999 RepID=A0A843YRB8_9BURK|nr:5-formyltetrahydrofolate cyclo-ligase [Glaciimonas soli]MQR00274.1 5-formyltetrahydrofolate cyclo-ligase [Glaciimonas soli]